MNLTEVQNQAIQARMASFSAVGSEGPPDGIAMPHASLAEHLSLSQNVLDPLLFVIASTFHMRKLVSGWPGSTMWKPSTSGANPPPFGTSEARPTMPPRIIEISAAVGSFAPTAVAWGEDNRTCAVRLVGHGPSARMENRVPGGDVNPYLALAALVAGGRHGIEQELTLEPELKGNANHSDKPHVPHTLREAREAWTSSEIARRAFGDEVVDHYTNMADVELKAFEAAVTDWELQRSFERL